MWLCRHGRKNSIKINLIRAIGCLLVSIAVFLFSRSALDTSGTWISVLSGIFNAFFLFLWILAAERVSLWLVELFCMIGSVVVPLILAPFLYKGEHVLWHQWICTGILIVSTFFFFPKPLVLRFIFMKNNVNKLTHICYQSN